MVLIVESGSTKSDWVLLSSENKQDIYSSMGFNPYFHSSSVIEKTTVLNSLKTCIFSDKA